MKKVGGVLLVVVVSWLVLVILAAVFQRQLLYLPDTSTPTSPDDVEEVGFTTSDGLELTGWFLAVKDPVTTVIVFPGNAGNRAARVPLARGLNERGHAVLLVDYRGYGGNPGSPSETGLVADALAARDYLASRGDVAPERIVYLGESIGSGVAAGLTRTHSPAALVLRSPFLKLADVGRSALPFLPVGLLLCDRYPIGDDLADSVTPLLVIAGENDTIVPLSLSRSVAEDLGGELVVIAGAGHNDAALFTGARFLDAVDDFVRTVVG